MRIGYIGSNKGNIDQTVINGLNKMLDKNNIFLKTFRNVKDCYCT